MIIKARAGKGGPALAKYLMAGKNEKAELLELRNLFSPNLKAAIFDMDMTAQAGRCENHAYHMQLRAAPGEQLTFEQWRRAADMCVAAFGMEHNEAALVLHYNPDGTTHAHLVVNRVNPDTFKAADLWHNHFKHKILARELEKEFGLRRVSNEKRELPRDYSPKGEKEDQQARAVGENVHDVRDRIRNAWEHSDCGGAFSAALAADGFVLARGDRRDFVAVSDTLGVYSIGKRTTGASAAQVRERMADLNPDLLPDVKEAKVMQERAKELEAEQERQKEKERQGKAEGDGRANAGANAGGNSGGEGAGGDLNPPGAQKPQEKDIRPVAAWKRLEEAVPVGRSHEEILLDVADALLSDTSEAQWGRQQVQELSKTEIQKEDDRIQRKAAAEMLAAFNAKHKPPAPVQTYSVSPTPVTRPQAEPLSAEPPAVKREKTLEERNAEIRRAIGKSFGNKNRRRDDDFGRER